MIGLALFILAFIFPNANALLSCKVSVGHRHPTEIGMAKKLRNKQAELMKKFESAKRQDADRSTSSDDLSEPKLSEKEIKEKNDRLRFEELLKTQSVGFSDLSSDNYLTKQQEEDLFNLESKGFDLLFEGDPAPTAEFNSLVPSSADKPLGESGAKRLIPWMSDGNQSSNFLVVICDPRQKSEELHNVIKAMLVELPKNLLKHTIAINADSAAENRRFLKKTPKCALEIFSDESRDWMTSYTALGAKRWSLTMFIIANGRIQKIAREVDELDATRTIQNAVKSMERRKL